MKLNELQELMEYNDEGAIEDLPDDLVAQYEQRAEDERAGGGSIDINDMLPTVGVEMSDGSEYFFQGEEAEALLSEVPGNMHPEDFILALAQNW